MRLVLGSDHAGYELKKELVAFLSALGHEVLDVGTCSTEAVDYPDFAEAVSAAVLDGRAERGVLICGSGVGASIAANKVPGVRAGLIHDVFSAHQGIEDDNMNVFCLGGNVIGASLAWELLENFLASHFSSAPRHRRRVAKVQALENQHVVL